MQVMSYETYHPGSTSTALRRVRKAGMLVRELYDKRGCNLITREQFDTSAELASMRALSAIGTLCRNVDFVHLATPYLLSVDDLKSTEEVAFARPCGLVPIRPDGLIVRLWTVRLPNQILEFRGLWLVGTELNDQRVLPYENICAPLHEARLVSLESAPSPN